MAERASLYLERTLIILVLYWQPSWLELSAWLLVDSTSVSQAVNFTEEEERMLLLILSQSQYVNNNYTILFQPVEGWLPEEQRKPRGVIKGIGAWPHQMGETSPHSWLDTEPLLQAWLVLYACRCAVAGWGQIEWLQSVQLCHADLRFWVRDIYFRYSTFGPWLGNIIKQHEKVSIL